MRTVKTSEAAAMLNVSPNTLRAWERRFGYPIPQRSAGRHRLYTYGEVVALHDALQHGLSISSAVSAAREALSTETYTLVGALVAFDFDRADNAMKLALALRSIERCVEEVTLPVRGVCGLPDVVGSLALDAVVLAGSYVGDDDVARWAYRVRADREVVRIDEAPTLAIADEERRDAQR